jgi:hypothetical protein
MVIRTIAALAAKAGLAEKISLDLRVAEPTISTL